MPPHNIPVTDMLRQWDCEIINRLMKLGWLVGCSSTGGHLSHEVEIVPCPGDP